MDEIDVIVNLILETERSTGNLNLLRNNVQNLNTALTDAENISSDLRDELVQAFNQRLNRRANTYNDVIKQINAELQRAVRREGQVERARNNSRRSIEDLTQELRDLEAQLRRAEANSDNFVRLRRAADATRRELQALQNQANLTGASLNRAGRSGRSFGQVLSSIGPSVVAAIAVSAAINQIQEAFSRTINTGLEFEAGLARLGAVSRATVEELGTLERQSRLLGETTTFTAAEAVEAAQVLAVAGFNVDEILAAQEGVLRLAEATGVDLARAADIAAITLRSYGIEAANITRVNDVLATSITSANLDIDAFAEAFKLAAPVARTAGLEFEETANIINTLADAGFRGSIGGTALRALLVRITAPSGRAKDALEDLGIAIEDLRNGNIGLIDLFQRLNEEQVTAAQLSDLFGKQFSTATIIIDALGEGLERPTELLQQFGLSLEEINELNLNGLDASAAALQQTGVEAAGLGFLFENLNADIRILPPNIQEAVRSLRDLSTNFDENVVSTDAFTQQVNQVRFVLDELVDSNNSFDISARTLATSLGLIASEVGNVDEAADSFLRIVSRLNEQGVLNDLGFNLNFEQGDVIPAFEDILENLQDTAESSPALITTIFGDDAENVNALISLTSDEFQTLNEALGEYSFALEVAVEANNNLQGDVTRLRSALSETSILLFERLSPFFREVVKDITEFIQGINQTISELDDFDVILAANETRLKAFRDIIAAIAGGLGIASFIRSIVGATAAAGSLRTVIQALGTAFTSAFTPLRIATLVITGTVAAISIFRREADRTEEELQGVNSQLEDINKQYAEGVDVINQNISAFRNSARASQDQAEVLEFVSSKYGELLSQEEARNLLLQGTAVLQDRLIRLEAQRIVQSTVGTRIAELERERDAVELLNSSLSESFESIQQLSTTQIQRRGAASIVGPLLDDIEFIQNSFGELPDEISSALTEIQNTGELLLDPDRSNSIATVVTSNILTDIQRLNTFIDGGYQDEINETVDKLGRQSERLQERLISSTGRSVNAAVINEQAAFDELIQNFLQRNVNTLDSQEVDNLIETSGLRLREQFLKELEADGRIEEVADFSDQTSQTILEALRNRAVELENQLRQNARLSAERRRELDREIERLRNEADTLIAEQNSQTARGIEESRRLRETSLRRLLAQIDLESLNLEQRLALINRVEQESIEARNDLLQRETDQIIESAEARTRARFEANQQEIAAATQASLERQRGLRDLAEQGAISTEDLNTRLIQEELRLSEQLTSIQNTRVDATRDLLIRERQERIDSGDRLLADATEQFNAQLALLTESLNTETITQEQFNEQRVEAESELSRTLLSIRRETIADLREIDLSFNATIDVLLGEGLEEAQRQLDLQLSEIALREENFRRDQELGAEQLAFQEVESFNQRIEARREYFRTLSTLLAQEGDLTIESQTFLLRNIQSQLELSSIDLQERLDNNLITIEQFNQGLLNLQSQFRNELAAISFEDVSFAGFLTGNVDTSQIATNLQEANDVISREVGNIASQLQSDTLNIQESIDNIADVEEGSLGNLIDSFTNLSDVDTSIFSDIFAEPVQNARESLEEFTNLANSTIVDETTFQRERIRIVNEFFGFIDQARQASLENLGEEQNRLVEGLVNSTISDFTRLNNFITDNNPADFGAALEGRPNLLGNIEEDISQLANGTVAPQFRELLDFTQNTSQQLIDEYLNFVRSTTQEAIESGDISTLSADIQRERSELFNSLRAFEATAGIIDGTSLNILSEEGRQDVVNIIENFNDQLAILRANGGTSIEQLTMLFADFAATIRTLGVDTELDLGISLDNLLPDLRGQELETQLNSLFGNSFNDFITNATDEQIQQSITLVQELEQVRRQQLSLTQDSLQQEIRNRTQTERDEIERLEQERAQAFEQGNLDLAASLNSQIQTLLQSIGRVSTEVRQEFQGEINEAGQSIQTLINANLQLQATGVPATQEGIVRLRELTQEAENSISSLDTQLSEVNTNAVVPDSLLQRLQELQVSFEANADRIRDIGNATNVAQDQIQERLSELAKDRNQDVAEAFDLELARVNQNEEARQDDLQRQKLSNENQLQSLKLAVLSTTSQTEEEFNENNFRLLTNFRQEELRLEIESQEARRAALLEELALRESLILFESSNPTEGSDARLTQFTEEREQLVRQLTEINGEITSLNNELLDETERSVRERIDRVFNAVLEITDILGEGISAITSSLTEDIDRNIRDINATFERLTEEGEAQATQREQQINNANLTDQERQILLDDLAQREEERQADLERRRDEALEAEEARKQRLIDVEERLEALRQLISAADTIRTNIEILNNINKGISDTATTATQLSNSNARIQQNNIEAASNTQTGLTAAVRNGNPITIALSIASILAALAIGFSSARRLIRQNQQDNENFQFADGGPVPDGSNGGRIVGNRHARGGVNINTEGGEFIFNREAVRLFGDSTLAYMNQQGLNMRRGRAYDASLSGLLMSNQQRSVRIPTIRNNFAQDGGLVAERALTSSANSIQRTQVEGFNELLEINRANGVRLDRIESATGLSTADLDRFEAQRQRRNNLNSQ